MSRELSGKKIECRSCGKTFTFTDEEQAFYAEKGFTEPKSCFHCRRIAKIARKETMGILKKYKIIRFDYSDTELAEGEVIVG